MTEGDAWTTWDKLDECIHLSEWYTECSTSVLHRGTSSQSTECTDLGDMIRSVFLTDISEHLLSSLIREIYVYIWHGDTRGIQESLEEQTIAKWIDIRDP